MTVWSVDNQARVSPQTRGTIYTPKAYKLEDQKSNKTIPWEVGVQSTQVCKVESL